MCAFGSLSRFRKATPSDCACFFSGEESSRSPDSAAAAAAAAVSLAIIFLGEGFPNLLAAAAAAEGLFLFGIITPGRGTEGELLTISCETKLTH